MNGFAKHFFAPALALVALCPALAVSADAPPAPDYSTKVAPILRKYCAGCHNAEDREGGLVLEDYAGILKGGEHGAVLTAGHSELSRLVRVLSGKAEPAMPPKDNEAPKPDEVAILKSWIDGGAKGPSGAEPDPTILITPKVKTKGPIRNLVSAVAVSPAADVVAFAGYGEVDLKSLSDGKSLHKLKDHRGAVNSISFSADGARLVAAAGEAGLFGEARLWNTADGQLIKTFQGHKDSLYAAELSPDGALLATGGYDQKIILWDVDTGKPLRTLAGHNGPVFGLAFRPDGKILASASGDRTVKLWNVADGARLDTLGQSLMELYAVAFSPDGARVVAGGVDNRIRVWSVSASGQEGTNPLLYSRFAHEAAILRLAYSRDGKSLVSSGQDRQLKIWNPATVTIRATLEPQTDWPAGLGVSSDGANLVAGRLDGTTAKYAIPAAAPETATEAIRLAETPPAVDYGDQPTIDQLPKIAEVEPNDSPDKSTPLALPGIATGKIAAPSVGNALRAVPEGGAADMDLFRFDAKRGEQWILETNAARSGSPVDTKIEVLSADGKPVERLLLRAVRDSELEFRGINSDSRGARLKNWEEMELNQYVYTNGEVNKLFMQRRGPDADAQFYPEGGSRFAFFDTSFRAHALGQPAYIVEPYPVGTKLPDNGLPTFSVYYENDDESQRKLGKDSRLTFVAPADGAYLARVSDVRRAGGDNYTYQLIVRRPRPDFKVTLSPANVMVAAGSGKEITVRAERLDNFTGPIRVDIGGLPTGFSVTTPIVIEAGHQEAKGVLSAAPAAAEPTAENAAISKVTATADVAGKSVTKDVNNLGTLKLAPKPKVLVYLEPLESSPKAASAEWPGAPAEVTIVPGAMVSCKLRVERNGFADRIALEVDNLPHGVIVEDIGLNGVLIVEGQTERTIFLACEKWVPDTSRLFHAVAKVEGDQVSLPMVLHVKRGK